MDLFRAVLPPVSNRESWLWMIELTDDDTGDLLDLTGWTFECELRRRGPMVNDSSGYTPNYDYGGVNDYGPVVTPTVTVVGTGQIQLATTLLQMRSLCPDTYSIALTGTDAGGTNTRQLFLGTLPVVFGGVT